MLWISPQPDVGSHRGSGLCILGRVPKAKELNEWQEKHKINKCLWILRDTCIIVAVQQLEFAGEQRLSLTENKEVTMVHCNIVTSYLTFSNEVTILQCYTA